MAPLRSRTKARASSPMSTTIPDFPKPPVMVATKTSTPSRSPSRSPIKKRVAISMAQKQALIDNLQLEITERARKLRAQYAVQAQGLRSRIEIRVNRIPLALRKTTLSDLLLKHSQPQGDKITGATRPGGIVAMSGALPSKTEGVTAQTGGKISTKGARNLKRTSDEMEATDKENKDQQSQHDLTIPKKRAKTKATPAAAAPPQSSRNIQQAQILSPKSSNTRTIPYSPVKRGMSPVKSNLGGDIKKGASAAPKSSTTAAVKDSSRPTRATATRKAPATASTRQTANNRKDPTDRETKRQTATATRKAGSVSSDGLNSTASVNEKGKKPPTRKGTVSKSTVTGNPGKTIAASDAPNGRRTLRKRN